MKLENEGMQGAVPCHARKSSELGGANGDYYFVYLIH